MGKEPSRILSIRLQENNLNDLFTDREFVKEFVGANKLDPFSDAALKGISKISPSLRFIPKSSKSRANAVLKISRDVNLSPEVQKLCDRLRDDPSSFSFANVCRNGDIATVCSDELNTAYIEHRSVTEKAQFYEVVDSLMCLYVHWCTLDFTGKGRYLQISDRLLSLGVMVDPKYLTNYCKEKSLYGKKIESFCTKFLGDIGTVFNLPREAKWFIISIGAPKENFQGLHQKLARLLIEAGIQSEARNTNGRKILEHFRNINYGTLSLTRSPSETRVSTTSPSSVMPSTISSQQIEASAEDASRDSATSEGTPTSNTSRIGRVDDILVAAALRDQESTGRSFTACDGPHIMPVEAPAESSVREPAVGTRKGMAVALEDYGTSYAIGPNSVEGRDSAWMPGEDSSLNHGQGQSERRTEERRPDGICEGIIDDNRNNFDRSAANLATTLLPPNCSQQSLATLGSVTVAESHADTSNVSIGTTTVSYEATGYLPYLLEDDQIVYMDNLQYPQGEGQTVYMDNLQYPQEDRTLYMDNLQYQQGEGQTVYMSNIQYPQEDRTLYMDNLQYAHGACQTVFGTREGQVIFMSYTG